MLSFYFFADGFPSTTILLNIPYFSLIPFMPPNKKNSVQEKAASQPQVTYFSKKIKIYT